MKKVQNARAALEAAESDLVVALAAVDRLKDVVYRVGGLKAAGEAPVADLKSAKADLSKAIRKVETVSERVQQHRSAVEVLEARERAAQEAIHQRERARVSREVVDALTDVQAKWMRACEAGDLLRKAVAAAELAGVRSPADFSTGGATPVVPPGLLVVEGVGPSGPQYRLAADVWDSFRKGIESHYRKNIDE